MELHRYLVDVTNTKQLLIMYELDIGLWPVRPQHLFNNNYYRVQIYKSAHFARVPWLPVISSFFVSSFSSPSTLTTDILFWDPSLIDALSTSELLGHDSLNWDDPLVLRTVSDVPTEEDVDVYTMSQWSLWEGACVVCGCVGVRVVFCSWWLNRRGVVGQ